MLAVLAMCSTPQVCTPLDSERPASGRVRYRQRSRALGHRRLPPPFPSHGLVKIYVGDPHQSIYAWRGSINALSDELPTTFSLPLTASHRCGRQRLLVQRESGERGEREVRGAECACLTVTSRRCSEAIASTVRVLLRVPILGRVDVRGSVEGPRWPTVEEDPGKTRAFLAYGNMQVVLVALTLAARGFGKRMAILGGSLRETLVYLRAYHHFSAMHPCKEEACPCRQWLKTNRSEAQLLDYAVWSGNTRLQGVIGQYNVRGALCEGPCPPSPPYPFPSLPFPSHSCACSHAQANRLWRLRAPAIWTLSWRRWRVFPQWKARPLRQPTSMCSSALATRAKATSLTLCTSVRTCPSPSWWWRNATVAFGNALASPMCS